MDTITYDAIKLKIKQSIVLNNGYQFDDLCHDTIEKLLNLKKNNKECKKLCAIIALNLIRDHHRKCKKIETIKLYELQADQIEYEKPEIIIPIKYRHLYVLKYKLGMKYREIAEHLERPLGTIKAQIFRMHQELKELNT